MEFVEELRRGQQPEFERLPVDVAADLQTEFAGKHPVAAVWMVIVCTLEPLTMRCRPSLRIANHCGNRHWIRAVRDGVR